MINKCNYCNSENKDFSPIGESLVVCIDCGKVAKTEVIFNSEISKLLYFNKDIKLFHKLNPAVNDE